MKLASPFWKPRGRPVPVRYNENTELPKWRVGELYVERRGSRSIVGNIYKGVVDNVLPGMEAAFVDIGLERNGFLHVDEIVTADGKPRRSAAAARAGGSTS